MSKKRKRQNRRQSQTRKKGFTASTASRSPRDKFDPDYTYVIKDLRRIGILAGTFLTILVILSFYLR